MTVLRTDGPAVGVRSRDFQIFSDGQITSFSYAWYSAVRASRERAQLLINLFRKKKQNKTKQ